MSESRDPFLGGLSAMHRRDASCSVGIVGSKSFGKAVAQTLSDDGHEVAWVVGPSKDGMNDSLLQWAREPDRRVPVVEPGDRNIPRVDYILLAHATRYVAPDFMELADYGTLGWHPSLLPRHRGRDAIRWAVAMGDPITGGTIYRVTEEVDRGPIVAQDWCFIGKDDDASSLWRDKLFPMGVRLYRDVMEKAGSQRELLDYAQPQDERYATWEPSWEREPLSGGS